MTHTCLRCGRTGQGHTYVPSRAVEVLNCGEAVVGGWYECTDRKKCSNIVKRQLQS